MASDKQPQVHTRRPNGGERKHVDVPRAREEQRSSVAADEGSGDIGSSPILRLMPTGPTAAGAGNQRQPLTR